MSKNWDFSKGVSPWFWSKIGWPFFQVFFFWQYKVGECVLRYFRTKKHFLGYKNKKFEKSNNWDFSKGVSPLFWSKIGLCSTFFSFDNIGFENVFYHTLQRIKDFLGYKTKKFQMSKNWDFSKAVSPWFWSKIGHFSTFFSFGNIG